ncbi:hypothetical protein MLD38_001688 [Melastoma candidum]|uniref:Uncharacterized protein n=1 Tax=Melastoma candidum TaxID=119954 RepID=A0ACB9SIY5_9MYRT|nr:hypothetical protein MLD38_001688 [Melastoma candidum]
MEFEEEHEEEQDEEMEIPDDHPQEPPLHHQPYAQPQPANSSPALSSKPYSPASSSAGVRYRECQKNHAVGIGGSAVDGCGEFMPAGEEGSLEALRCAACNCHRNFHRRETTAESSPGGMLYPPPPHQYHHYGPGPYQQFSSYYRAAPAPSGYLQLTSGPLTQRQLALPAAPGGPSSSREDAEDYPGSSGGSGSMKKRFRTKFTQEQKDRMLAFAERLGWRIQKHDDPAVEQFCIENGIRRHVLKVWMHNNKHTLGKKP